MPYSLIAYLFYYKKNKKSSKNQHFRKFPLDFSNNYFFYPVLKIFSNFICTSFLATPQKSQDLLGAFCTLLLRTGLLSVISSFTSVRGASCTPLCRIATPIVFCLVWQFFYLCCCDIRF